MNSSPPPIVSDLVLIGGGHAHVHVLKMLGMAPYRQILKENGIRVTLVAKDVHTPYSGMLPGFVSGHYTYDEIHIDLRKLCRFSNIQLIAASCTKIEYDNKTPSSGSSSPGSGGGWVWCNDDRPPIRYDVLSIDVGSSPGASDRRLLQSGSSHVIPVKPIASFCRFYQRLQQEQVMVKKEEQQCQNSTTTNRQPEQPQSKLNQPKPRKYRICVVGGGAGGIELALSIQYNLKQILGDSKDLEMILITRGKSFLQQHNTRVQSKFQRVLRERNIQVRFGCEAIGVETTSQSYGDGQEKSNKLILKDTDNTIEFDDCFVCTTASGSPWLQTNTPFQCDNHGFIKVDATYQVVDGHNVFAVGDCCSNIDHPRPKAGVFAVRAGPPLFENLIAALLSKPLKAFKPQSTFLSLISTGDQNAIASKGNYLCFEGKYMWNLKDYIDRAFMDKFSHLPDMKDMQQQQLHSSWWWSCTTSSSGRHHHLPPAVKQKSAATKEAFTADLMRCGGCGAKVGSTSLSRVLRQLHKRQVRRAKERNLPIPPPIDHDDAAITPVPMVTANGSIGGGAMINTIDYFRALIEDPYIFGKVVAVHALSDVHAMGGAATAQTALSLAVIPFAADDAIVESTLLQLLAGMSDVLQDENVRMIGGHTCEGLELACGLAVQGYTPDPQRLLRKRGGKVGDVIVLTKPIGTGALFALDMRAKAKGGYLLEALSFMEQSNGTASRIAADQANGVRSCTDVTGFGLLGHLLEMLMANDDEDDLDCIGAKIRIEDVPFLLGGIEASKQGVYSSLQPQNARTRRAVKNHAEAAKISPVKYPLLFDPCTAGGLMMFVDRERSVELLSALEAEGVHGSVIGELVAAVKQAPLPAEDSDEEELAVCTLSGAAASRRIEIEL